MVHQSLTTGVRRLRKPILVAIGIGVVLLGAAAGGLWLLFAPFRVVRDINQYPKLRSQASGSLFAHFPDAVSGGVYSADMYFDPGVWQAPTRWELLLRVSEAEAQRVLDEFTPRAVLVPEEQAEWFPASALAKLPLGPVGFVVIPLHCPKPEEFNHANFAGIAINVHTGEVLYWAETG